MRQTIRYPFRVYVLGIVGFTAATLTVSLMELPIVPTPAAGTLLALAMLATAVAVADNLTVYLPGGGSTSLSLPLCVAANILVGPAGAGIVAIFTAFNIEDLRQRRSPWILMFNAAQLVCVTVLAGWSYLLLGGRVLAAAGPVDAAAFPQLLAPLGAALLVSVVLNGVFVSVGIGLHSNISPVGIWRDKVSWTLPMQFAMACLGVAIAQVLAIQPVGFVLFLFPLVVSRQMYQRYVGLRDAYRDTVQSLVAAIEAKDHYTRGHSERVAEYAVAIARQMRLTEAMVERVEFAALLHDLGKVGISGKVLMKQGPLSAQEWAEIREHPVIGARIVERVPYLVDLVGAVRSHHERHDGGGYCEGLAGEEVPFEARILAVADSYDAMTTERPYRPALTREAAIEEIKAGTGKQFDPASADAFLRWLAPELKEAGAAVAAGSSQAVIEDA